MKILKVILLLVLISKNSLGLSIDVGLSSSSNCCSETIEMEASSTCPSNDSEEEKSNCCNVVCDCICCGHIFTFNNTTEILSQAPLEIEATAINSYKFLYAHKFSTGIWQPPRLA